MEQQKRIVEFEKYCKKCKHYKLKETKDPCNNCLDEPVNDDSRKPVYFEEADSKK